MNPIAGLKRRIEAAGRRLDEASLSPEARQVREEHLTYLSTERLRRLERGVQEALRRSPSGDVLEFGVAMGGSAVILAKRARAAGRRFAGFDVFAMIPPPTSDKDDEKSRSRYEVIASGRSEGIGGRSYYGYRDNLYDEVTATFARHGVPPDGSDVQLIKGLFEETWPAYATDSVCFAHIDCDWYDPVRYCLEQVAEKLTPGGIMMLDDYNDYGGCRAAADEFIAARPEFRFEPGANPIIRRVVS